MAGHAINRDIQFFATLLTSEEETGLNAIRLQGGQAGQEAREKLIHSQLRWAFRLAKNRAVITGEPIDELLSDAYYTVIRAVDGFDHTKAKLSTYLFWAFAKSGRNYDHRPRHEISCVSLDACTDDDERSLYDETADERFQDPCTAVISHDERSRQWRRLKRAIRRLPPRYRTLLKLRMDGLSHRQIGEKFGVTKSRAEQIEKLAIGRIRKSLRIGKESNGLNYLAKAG